MNEEGPGPVERVQGKEDDRQGGDGPDVQDETTTHSASWPWHHSQAGPSREREAAFPAADPLEGIAGKEPVPIEVERVEQRSQVGGRGDAQAAFDHAP